MNIRKIGILGLMAMMGIFWGCTIVEATVETVRAYRTEGDQKQLVNEATIFGTVSEVFVIATGTGMSGGSYMGIATAAGSGDTYFFWLYDDGFLPDVRANDGVYTASFFTISMVRGGGDLSVGNGQTFKIEVDIDDLGDPGSVTLSAEYVAPSFIDPPSVTKTSIPLDGTTTIKFRAKDDIQNGTWTYSIRENSSGKLLSGTSIGTCTGPTPIEMIWDGRDNNGDSFPSGKYYINVKIEDEAGNSCQNATATVMIDTILPQISNITVSPSSYFATGTAVTISFTGSDNSDKTGLWAYFLSCNGQLLFGTGAVGTRTIEQMINFIWDGRYGIGTLLGEGQHEIVLELRDSVGNITFESIYITIDNTAPGIENPQFSSNLASPNNPLKVSFIGVESTYLWTYKITIGGQITQGTQGTSPFGTISSNSEPITFIWPATDKNGSPFAEGDHVVELTLTDRAGNFRTATSNVKVDGTSPKLTNLSISNQYFSPYGSPSTNLISFNGSDNLGTWTYSISIDDSLLDTNGAILSTGILGNDNGTVNFAWNGKNVQGAYLSSGLATITVQLKDIAGNTGAGAVTVVMDTVAPTIISSSISEQSFSLEGDKQSTTIEFTAADNIDMWTYRLTVDGTQTPAGTGSSDSATGTRTGTGTVRFIWDGKYTNGTGTDGTHTFTINVMDRMGNLSTKNFSIVVDMICPNIYKIKENTSMDVKSLDEEILFSLEADSPGEAAILLTSSLIQSAEEVVKGGENIRTDYGWRQFEGDIVGGTIDIYVIGTSCVMTSFAISDNYLTVQDLINDINTRAFGNSTYGEITYSPSTDKFTIQAGTYSTGTYSIGLRESCLEAYRMPFFTSAKLFTGFVSLYSIGATAGTISYQGKYSVPLTAGEVTCSVIGLFKDNGGNKALNYGTKTGTVKLNGQQKIDYENVKIIGLRVEPNPSKQVFNITNKRMTFSLIAGEIDKEIKGASIEHGNGTVTLRSSEIQSGDAIIVWNDGLGVGMEHGRVWRIATATTAGEVSISNNNNTLCFGDSLSSYGTESLRDDYFHIAKGRVLKRGIPSISLSIGNIETNVLLYDDGNDPAHHDRFDGDGIFSGFYEIPDGFELSGVPIFAHLMVTKGKTVLNDGYPFNDGERLPFNSSYLIADTLPLNNIYIDMDTIKPIVTLLGSTLPFNPEAGKSCEIKYVLTKTLMANVQIVIKDGYLPGANIIKDLGFQTAHIGDNVCYWRGDKENGELVADNSYYYFIYTIDKAGNKAEEIFGVTKVSRVHVDLVEVKVVASKTNTGNTGEGAAYVNIGIDCMLNGSQQQLQNLDFDTDYSLNVYDRPYALFHIVFFDKNGTAIWTATDDLDSDVDSDPFPNDFPNYIQRMDGTIVYRDNTYSEDSCCHLGETFLKDVKDDNKGNDFDTLVPFDKVSLTDANETKYHAKLNFKSGSIKLAPGSYYARIYVELVAGDWKFIDYEKSTSGDFIAEKWHCESDSSHYGLATEYKDYRFEIPVGADFPVLDNVAPDVYESYPGAGTKAYPKDIKSGNENKDQGVWVRVGDQGLGVDFSVSSIMLLGPNGLEVSGSPVSNGNDKLYWVIDNTKYPEGLNIPGEYTIKIKVYDKAKNLTEAVRSFTIIDQMPPEVSVEILPTGNIYEGQKITLIGFVSEYNTGGSAIDKNVSTIILLDGQQNTISIDTPQLIETDKTLSMTVILNELMAGTYTVQVIGWDVCKNKTVRVKEFYVGKGISVPFVHPKIGTVTAMNIIPFSRITYNGTSTEIGPNTLSVRELFSPGSSTVFDFIGVPIEILMGTVSIKDSKVDKDMMLRLWYTTDELEGYTEKDIKIYRYGEEGWEQVNGVQVNTQLNQAFFTISANTIIMGSYTLGYPIIGDISITGDSAITETWKGIDNVWMTIPGSATIIGGKMVKDCARVATTVGTASVSSAPEGWKMLLPVVLFKFDDIATVTFSHNVKIRMHYDLSSPSLTGIKEGDLIVYGFSGGTWSALTKQNDAKDGTIILTTNATKEAYVIMYKLPTGGISEEKATAEFKESAHCYPNPSRGNVTFTYNLVFGSKITVKVYTMLGDIVWEGSDHTHVTGGVGLNGPTWDCRNTAGEKVASGLYLYRITMEPDDKSAAVTVTKKLIVVQ